jgi:hypothetical protein
LIRTGYEVYGPDGNGAKQGSVANPFKYDNHISGSIKTGNMLTIQTTAVVPKGFYS